MEVRGFSIITNNVDETLELGRKLGLVLQAGYVVALFGDLGAGKTTFTKGVAVGLNIDDDIHSPTFTIIHEHFGRIPLYHIDLYRLASGEEIFDIGIEEYINSNGATLIEWADKMQESLPDNRLNITINVIDDDIREFVFESDSSEIFEEVNKCLL